MPLSSVRDLRTLADLMDRRFRGPFGWRFGWDGILGLIPVVGDMVTNAVSAYIILRAAHLGCPPSVIFRMVLNLLVENLVDLIPVFGNLFDFAWKANVMNVALAERHLTDPRGVRRGSRLLVATLLVGFIGAAVMFTTLSVMLILKVIENL